MKIRKMTQTPAEVAEDENCKATVEKQKEKIENQNVLIQYLAAMTEEEEENHVQNIDENEGNLQ